jgi:hypothetical protein
MVCYFKADGLAIHLKSFNQALLGKYGSLQWKLEFLEAG